MIRDLILGCGREQLEPLGGKFDFDGLELGGGSGGPDWVI